MPAPAAGLIGQTPQYARYHSINLGTPTEIGVVGTKTDNIYENDWAKMSDLQMGR
jgi:hypothetical protein